MGIKKKSYSGKEQSFTVATASLPLNRELNSCLYLGFLRAARVRRQGQKHGNALFHHYQKIPTPASSVLTNLEKEPAST